MANDVVSSPTSAAGAIPDNDKYLSAVGYVWICCALPLFLVPMFGAKESAYAQYHAKQAAVLYIVGVVASIAAWIFAVMVGIGGSMAGIPFVACVGNLVQGAVFIGGFVMMILGAVNSMQGQQKELPVIGAYASKLPF